jgi:phosphohistidine phosphatase
MRRMRTLLLLRHATTEGIRPGHPDRARRLTPEGERQATAVGDHLRRNGTTLDVVLCSPATRVRQTVAALQLTAPVVVTDELYDAGGDDILELIRSLDEAVDHVLIVGHAPGLPATAHELADPDSSDPRAIATIDGRFPAAALATLNLTGPWADLRRAALMSVRLP